ncbi:hypothetical protein J4419_02610 [Candidatus Woesearchaeota archaeon]|nr:hypothetical protein [Candidatus Woesearchaeota archaeon]
MKKGLTPLISTILLLGFALGLGMLVISWGQARAPPAMCSGLSVVAVDSQPQLCVKEGRLYGLLENTGDAPITRVQATMLMQDGVLTEDLDLVIQPGSFSQVWFSSTISSDVQKVRLVPSTAAGLCVEGKIDADFVGDC